MSKPQKQDELLSARQVAKTLSVSKRIVQEWGKTGALPGIKLGRLWKFRQSDVDRALRTGLKNVKRSKGPKQPQVV